VLGTSTRTSDVLINLGLNPLRRLREVGSLQFGVLFARAPPSPRCTALTAASCETMGRPRTLVHEYRTFFRGKMASERQCTASRNLTYMRAQPRRPGKQ